jgi:hypothetical protein
VTNALYLMAAHGGGHTDPAKKELTFLETWFNDNKTPLWWRIDANAGLVRERVGHFANGSPAPGYQDDWFWTGDQGLMLGNLSDAARGGDANALRRVQHLLAGVTGQLVENSTGVLRDWSKTGTVPGNDTPDYETGSGVFWRNALYVWNSNDKAHAFLRGEKFQAMLRKSADAAANSRDTSFDALTNQLSVLVAATKVLA